METQRFMPKLYSLRRDLQLSSQYVFFFLELELFRIPKYGVLQGLQNFEI
jgi:hypothetical protein